MSDIEAFLLLDKLSWTVMRLGRSIIDSTLDDHESGKNRFLFVSLRL